jgi:hypothetical protein
MSGDEFNDSIAGQTDPEIYDETQVELVRAVPGDRRQKRHKDEEIKCVATDDRDKGFCEVSPHKGLDTAEPPEVASAEQLGREGPIF